MNRVPILRFKEFEGEELSKKNFGEVFNSLRNNSLSRANLNLDSGDIRNIHYGDIHTKLPTIVDIKQTVIPFINTEVDISKFKNEDYAIDGDIVVADASEDYVDIGRTVELINIGNSKVVAGLHTIFARCNGKLANGYKGYLMNSNGVHNQVRVLATSSKVVGISKTMLNTVKLIYPSLPEQEKIAEFLSSFDSRIEIQEKKVETAQEIKKGLMQIIFSQEVRFKDENGEDYSEWELKSLGEVGNIVTGSTPKTAEVENYGSDYLWVSPMDLGHRKYIDYTNRKLSVTGFNKTRKVPKGSILVTCIGSTIGKMGMASCNMSTNQQINSIVCFDGNNSEFLYYNIESNINNLLEVIATQAVPILNKTTFSGIEFDIPSLPEQERIAEVLSTIDEKIEIEKEILETLKEIKKGLLQQMFV